jgi:hypothetical protein
MLIMTGEMKSFTVPVVLMTMEADYGIQDWDMATLSMSAISIPPDQDSKYGEFMKEQTPRVPHYSTPGPDQLYGKPEMPMSAGV